MSTQAYAPAATLPRLLQGVRTSGAMSLQEHIATHGEMPPGLLGARRGTHALIDEVEDAGLRGRGGGRLPHRRQDARGAGWARRTPLRTMVGQADRGRERGGGRTGEPQGPHPPRSAAAARARRRRGRRERGGCGRGDRRHLRARRQRGRKRRASDQASDSGGSTTAFAGTSPRCPPSTSRDRSRRS